MCAGACGVVAVCIVCVVVVARLFSASPVTGGGDGGMAAGAQRGQDSAEGSGRLGVVGEVENGLASVLTNLIRLWCIGEGRGAELGSMVAMAAGLETQARAREKGREQRMGGRWCVPNYGEPRYGDHWSGGALARPIYRPVRSVYADEIFSHRFSVPLTSRSPSSRPS